MQYDSIHSWELWQLEPMSPFPTISESHCPWIEPTEESISRVLHMHLAPSSDICTFLLIFAATRPLLGGKAKAATRISQINRMILKCR